MTNGLRLIGVAPLHWSAGYDDLLLAVRGLVDRRLPVSVRVVADGPARERFLFNVWDLGLEREVELVSPRPPESLGDLAKQVVVLAAVDDRPWPETIGAGAHSRRVVATDLPWIRGHLTASCPRAVLVPPRSPAHLADALAEIAKDHRS